MMSIEEIKRLNLWEFVEKFSYWEDKKETSNQGETKIYRHDNEDKIGVTRLSNGRFLWVGNRPNDDRGGTIIDFICEIEGVSPAVAIKQLRGNTFKVEKKKAPKKPKVDIKKDFTEIRSHVASLRHMLKSEYLQSRGIKVNTYVGGRFQGKVREDEKGNAIFPHYSKQGVTGYEIKNTDYTAFSAGGIKTLWTSNCKKTDNRIVFCESAIDCLSYHQLFAFDDTRYFSIGGRPNEQQKSLITLAVKHLENPDVILAFDNDKGGRELADKVSYLLKSIPCTIRVHVPDKEKMDWNEILKIKAQISEKPPII